ncbi:transmembrane and ubiquitin-like domain-containing protein 1 [Sitophilus oryzae]|uniref:Transmembrane and ubiquitin-like domain-containing protein 1 n=1 Tax=Sitophilus oryzae TaxID=7048 RepID=A0A6J2XD47_SITOR|nr:transmembrane and ubiquitin-like domain-containing protein 1 [Sitophilus oryzae]
MTLISISRLWSLIEGVEDVITHICIAVFSIIIVYIAWWSTSITDQRLYRTVLLLDRRSRAARSFLRGIRFSRRLSNHTETVTISEGSTSTSTTSSQIEEQSESSESSSNLSEPLQTQPKPNEVANNSNNSQTTEESTDIENFEESTTENNNLENIQEFEERNIIETMDADTQNTVRQRRLAHFENTATTSNEDSATSNIQLEGRKTVTHSDIKEGECKDDKEVKTVLNSNSQSGCNKDADPSNITIKLKYINDDIRIVDGRLHEPLGDFKVRHFETELNSNKIVRLIFNGQVLKEDRQSLQNCGLFNNCVVHCLIHQKRPSISDELIQGNIGQNPELLRGHSFTIVTNINNNNNQGIDWDLGNFLFALISFMLLAAWYFRYVYAHLYTVTASVGLLIITGIFSIVLIGTYFPDNDQIVNPTHTRIRIV